MATKKINHAAGAVSLKVLAERKEVEGISKATMFMVDPTIVRMEDGFNGRPIDPAHVAEIKQAMSDGATFDPLKVSVDDGVITVRDGHHRLTAMLQLIADGMEILRTPCIEFKEKSVADRIALMIGSGMGKPLTPLQLGTQYKRLVSPCGWSVKQIADRFGKSGQHVSDMIALANSGDDVQAMVTRGEVSAAVALKVVKKERGGAAKALADGLADARTKGKAKMTPKNLVPKGDLGKSYVDEVKQRATAATAHLKSMLDAHLPDEADVAVRAVLAVMRVKVEPAPTITNDMLNMSARPPSGAPTAHQLAVWLMGYGASPDPVLRCAAETMYKAATGAPIPMPMHEAVLMERNSNGSVMAENLCPDHAALIAYLRSTGS